MAATRLDGRAVSAAVQAAELAPRSAAFRARVGRPVGLAVVVVGARKDSATYVRMKQRACEAVGIASWKVHIDVPGEEGDELAREQQDAVVARLMDTIRELNARADVDGIIVQLPLPRFCDEDAILKTVDPGKDVDGLHPASHAALFQHAASKAVKGEQAPRDFSVPCTPAGCIELLDHYNIPLEGKHVVVIGRSKIVGLPVSLLCLHRNATVTMCHSRTADLPQRVREADIIIAAIGRARFVQGDWIKPGAAVIDVGINAVDDASKKAGYRLVGDVDYDTAVKVAGAITPVPGGIGPMTVTMLLRNTLNAAERNSQPESSEQSHAGP
jgi:5,10-methylene-tetrahydrofolate dehydrogenase/methenyl tetrahydrofolate cyclohydrolase